MDDNTGVMRTKWSPDLKDSTKNFQKEILKGAKYTCGTLMPAEECKKVTMHFKNMAKHFGERINMNCAATFPSKEDSDTDVCGKLDVKRRKSQDVRILNSSEKNKKTTKLKESSVLEDIKEMTLTTRCSSVPGKNSSKPYDFSRKQFKKPYTFFSIPVDSLNPNLQAQACQEGDLEKAQHTSSKLAHKSDRQIPCAPSGHLLELSKYWKCYKQKEQQSSDFTKYFGNSQSQGKKFVPVTFRVSQVKKNTSCEK